MNSNLLLLWLFAVIVLFTIKYRESLKIENDWANALNEIATMLGFRLINGDPLILNEVRGFYSGYSVTIQTVSIFISEAISPWVQTCVSLSLDQAVDQNVYVYARSIFSKKTIETGDLAFDKKYCIKVDSKKTITKFLSNRSIRRQLMTLSVAELKVSDDAIKVFVNGFVCDVNHLQKLIEVSKDIARTMQKPHP